VFTQLCKVFYLLQRKPAWLLLAAFLATLWALVPLRHFEVRASVADLLPSEWESVRAWKSFGNKFGSAGHLAIVVHSPDPARNAATVERLARELGPRADVNFLEYRTEAEFYRRHKLLYITLEDLREVERRVETGFWLNRSKRNPLITRLLEEDESERAFDASGFEDLEAKYFSRLKDALGSADSTTLVLRVYPTFDATDIHACRAFLEDVERVAARAGGAGAPGGPEILYTGDVVRTIHNEGKLFSRVLFTTRVALLLSGALLLVNFLRFPVGALLALIPVAMATLWTAALTLVWIGPLGVVTAPLSLLMIGLGLTGAVHLLARYSEERRKRLSAEVAFETITLETGPALTAGLTTLALAFLAFRATDFKALADFGLIAGIGMVCTLVAVLVVFPALLRLVEPTGLLKPLGPRLYNSGTTHSRPFLHARVFLALALLLSVVLLRHGPQWRFLADVDRLGFQGSSARADSLLRVASEELGTPAVYLAPNSAQALEIARVLRARQGDSGSAIGDVTTLEDLLPADMEEKLRITARLRRSITPAVIASAREPLRTSLATLSESWPERALTLDDLPQNYRLKFLGPGGSPGVFTYAFPRNDPREGVNLLGFAREVRSVTLPPGSPGADPRRTRTYYAGGWPVVYGDLMAHMLPDARKALAFGLAVIFLVLWLTVGSFRGAVILLLPVIATLAWTLGSLKWLGIKINPYNLIAFPVALAYATLHALVIYYRYEEEGRGSLSFVLKRTGRTALVSTVVAAAGFIPMAFSEHYGLSSLGIATVVGLACGLVASLLFLGAFLGIWEARAARREKSAR
jgi:predicted RND superfamily exporter protein